MQPRAQAVGIEWEFASSPSGAKESILLFLNEKEIPPTFFLPSAIGCANFAKDVKPW